MRNEVATVDPRELLPMARKVANYAVSLGARQTHRRQRPWADHLGAIMADAILQAGLNYRTVVYPRVAVILEQYPEAHSLRGVKAIIQTDRLTEFLRWGHSTKLGRFLRLTFYFDQHHVETAEDLRGYFEEREFRDGLLGIPGIGPKTVDYLACLAGIDVIAVDRHISSFARKSGVAITDYYRLRAVFSYAADLLELSRRDFDSWVWTTMSSE